MVINSSTIYGHYWQSKLNARGTSTSNDEAPVLKYENYKLGLQFTGHILRQNKVTFNHEKIVNIYIVYELSPHTSNTDFTLENCLFGAVKVTKNSNVDKCNYSGYAICFDSRGTFSLGNGYAKNIIIFGCDLTSSAHADNRANNILILGKGIVQGINGTSLYAGHGFIPNFTVADEIFCLSLHYNGNNGYLFVNGKEIVKLKAAAGEIVPYPLCLGNISKDFSSTNIQKTGLFGYVYDFNVDYKVIANDKIQDIHTYLMKNNSIA